MQSTLPQSNQHKNKGIGSLILLGITIALSAGLWFNRQLVADASSYFNYKPTAAVELIAARNNFTDIGKFYFYADNPGVNASATFSSACDNKESGTAILGCYVGNRIYIFDVTDKRLDGVEEVTAAHELLHAIYQRMSDDDKARVDKLVEAEYEKLKDDPVFAERMAYYARTEPGERDNELHSIIGTEVASISTELEAHYKQYFNDRSVIVAYHDAYNGEFVKLANQAKSLSSQMDKLNKQIATMSKQYNTDVKKLNLDITDFNQRATNGGFSSQSQFNTERQALEDRAAAIATEHSGINNRVDKFNKLRGQYNDIVTQSNDLYKSIDSSIPPAPKV